MMSLGALVLFIVMMILGLPIAFAMGLSAVAVIWWNGFPLAVIAQRFRLEALGRTPLHRSAWPSILSDGGLRVHLHQRHAAV